MSGLLVGLAVTLAILYVFGWIALLLATGSMLMESKWLKASILAAAWIAATVVPIAVGVNLASGPDTHGSCKVGHYETGAKAQRYFYCDEYYPLPEVRG